jgi:hypothetical protein
MQMTKELQDKSIQLMEVYRSNPTFPFDFFTVSMRKIDTKIQAIREIYKRITKEEYFRIYLTTLYKNKNRQQLHSTLDDPPY